MSAEPAGLILFALRKSDDSGVVILYVMTKIGIEAEEKAIAADRMRYFRQLIERLDGLLGHDRNRIYPKPGSACSNKGAEP